MAKLPGLTYWLLQRLTLPRPCRRAFWDERPCEPHSTIIVSGAARSGTSFVAAALSAAGLWLGDGLDGICFEDIDMASAIVRSTSLTRRVHQVCTQPRNLDLALRGIDVAHLKAAIAYRDVRHASWGFKRPGVLKRLGPAGIKLFRSPRAIVCFRDPIALARRSATADGVPLSRALAAARRHLADSLSEVSRLDCPTLLLSFEKIKTDPADVLEQLFEFCGLQVAPDQLPAIVSFVAKAGAEYSRVASAPMVGALDRPLGWTLSGWCRPMGGLSPAAIDILADGRRLLTAAANLYRPDLLDAGFKSACHGFLVDLHELGLSGTETIEVVLAGTSQKLLSSGFTPSGGIALSGV